MKELEETKGSKRVKGGRGSDNEDLDDDKDSEAVVGNFKAKKNKMNMGSSYATKGSKMGIKKKKMKIK